MIFLLFDVISSFSVSDVLHVSSEWVDVVGTIIVQFQNAINNALLSRLIERFLTVFTAGKQKKKRFQHH